MANLAKRRCDSAVFSAQKRLRDLKSKISAQSKKNFVLERDVRYLDSRIALLIQNRMALDEVRSNIYNSWKVNVMIQSSNGRLSGLLRT